MQSTAISRHGQMIHNQKQETDPAAELAPLLPWPAVLLPEETETVTACSGKESLPSTKPSYMVIPGGSGSVHLPALNYLCNFRLATHLPGL